MNARTAACVLLAALVAPEVAVALPDGPTTVFADQVPLGWVAEKMVPSGVPLVYEPPVTPNVMVSVKEGPSWQEALREAVEARGLIVDYKDQGVVFRDPAAIDADAASGPELAGWRLQMALPGRAWVIAPGQDSLGPVEIKEGQSHPVLGRIVRILQDGNRWIVQTHKGWFAGGPS